MKRVCVDVGGTFTDCIVLNEEDGTFHAFKAHSTVPDPSVGFIDALQKAARHYGQTLEEFLADIGLLVHGTTLATNTLLTGTGARTGLITTKGFRDSIEMRRGRRDPRVSMYNLFIPPYEPLVPRHMRLGVPERLQADGEVLEPLDGAAVAEAVRALKAEGVESVAIGFLYSYLDPTHERAAADLARAELDGVPVTQSHEVLPVWREFERFSTTVVSAYVEPKVSAYLKGLEQRLDSHGFSGQLLMVLSNGLMQTVDQCLGRAVYLLSSGPAAAPPGAKLLAERDGGRNLISMDMGGTSLDVCLIPELEIPMRNDAWVGDHRVAMKMVDVKSIGAGGSSIASIDSLGLLRVGPQSAGSDPGPACFGKGEEPTVTDGNLVLGFLADDYFLGGEKSLSVERAREAMRKVGEPLGMDVVEAAQAIFDTTNASMADLIVEACTRQGFDVRDFTMVVGGGAGAIHGPFIADLTGIRRLLVPSFSGVLSAFGMFTMDVGRDFARSTFARGDGIKAEPIAAVYAEMEAEAHETLAGMAVETSEAQLTRTAEFRYVGQFHEVEIPIPGGEITQEVVVDAIRRFHIRHEEMFSFAMPWQEVEMSTCRLLAAATPPPFSLPVSEHHTDVPVPARSRACRWAGRTIDTPVYRANELEAGHVLSGPAVIEAELTTVAIPEGWRLEVDRHRNYVLER